MSANRYDVIIAMIQRCQTPAEFNQFMQVFVEYEATHQPKIIDAIERDKVKQEETIVFRNNLLTLRNANQNYEVLIDTSNSEDISRKIKQLEDEQIDALIRIEQQRKTNPEFERLLDGIAKEKNIVRGNISNVNSINIGDEIHYYYHYYKIIKQEINKEYKINLTFND